MVQMMNMLALRYPGNAVLDTSGLSNALSEFGQVRRDVEATDYSRQQAAEEKSYARGRQVKADQMQLEDRLGNMAVSASKLPKGDPRRASALQRILSQHPNPSSLAPEYNNPETGLDLIAADYGKFRDPMAEEAQRLEIEKTKAEIGKLNRGPDPAETPSNVREWEYYSKLTPEQQTQYRQMRRNENAIVGDTLLNQGTGAPVANVGEAIQRGEQQKVVGREAGERQSAGPKALSALQAADAKSDVVLSTIAEARKMIGPMTAGFGGSLLSNVPGTGARDLAAKIDTLKANAGFAELQAMRDNSPTGGALGQVAVQELAMLQATITSLEQSQTPEQLSQALDAYEKFVRESKVRRKLAYDLTYGQSGGQQQRGGQGFVQPVAPKTYNWSPDRGLQEAK